MCSVQPGLPEVREALSRFAAGFEPAEFSATDARVLVGEAAQIHKMAATVMALAARRVADTELWRGGGDRTPAHDLARVAGTSVGQARDALATAERLGELGEVDRAARRGELSPRQAAAIAGAAAADPAAQTDLLEMARSASLRELQDECARVKAAAEPDADARHREIHQRRNARTWTDGGGTAHFHASGTPDRIAAIWAVVDTERDRLFRHARQAGRREPVDAYAFDALDRIVTGDATTATGTDTTGTDTTGARSGGVRRPRPKVVVRIDWDALVRGWPTGGELSEIAGVGPVPVSVVRAMIDSGDAFLAAVVTRGADVVNVAHLHRSPTAHQRSALDWTNPTCTVQGCPSPGRYEIDHRHDWATTRITLLGWLDRLCDHHHHLKTRDHWALTPGHGKRPLVAPDDPRHPNHTHDPPLADSA